MVEPDRDRVDVHRGVRRQFVSSIRRFRIAKSEFFRSSLAATARREVGERQGETRGDRERQGETQAPFPSIDARPSLRLTSAISNPNPLGHKKRPQILRGKISEKRTSSRFAVSVGLLISNEMTSSSQMRRGGKLKLGRGLKKPRLSQQSRNVSLEVYGDPCSSSRFRVPPRGLSSIGLC